MTDLKLLMSQTDYDLLKKTKLELPTYLATLKSLKDTFANEARRAINYTRKIDVAVKEGERLLMGIDKLLK